MSGTQEGPPRQENPLAQLNAAHDQAVAQFKQTGKAMAQIKLFQNTLDELTKLGDTVTPDDLIEASGKLVAHGQDPMQIANLLSGMPQGGTAIQGWLGQHAQALQSAMAQVAPAHEAARHALAVSVVHGLAGHAVHGPGTGIGAPGPVVAAQPPLNALTGAPPNAD